MIKTYSELRNKYNTKSVFLRKKSNSISSFRLLLGILTITFVYFYFKTQSNLYLFLISFLVVLFLVMIRFQNKIKWRLKVVNNLIEINKNELLYLKNKTIPFAQGDEYVDLEHPYSFDLDIFGKNSLFHHLNRTATYIGSKKLATLISSMLSNEAILLNQKAIFELSEKLSWRQKFLALAKMSQDTKKNYDKIIFWASLHIPKQKKTISFLLYFFPTTLFSLIIGYYFTKNIVLLNVFELFFLSNLLITLFYYKKIKSEIIDSDEISNLLTQYGLILKKIEDETFLSKKLINLQLKLYTNNQPASYQIKKLTHLYLKINSIQNPFVMFIFNGFALYHIHILQKLLLWKRKNAEFIKNWFEVVGEYEALNSLSNFLSNNKSFVFPALNNDFKIDFTQLGHPLLNAEKRVCNDVVFNKNNFIILTGSNMSGKSTFLRTLGINMVLAGIGAPICATDANIHPLKILVSMRQSDNLFANESYFFAEIKRLKSIMDDLETKTCFVLLDEIVKGTNSDDKKTGTVAVIKKMIVKKAMGIIATHDLEVCNTVYEFPNKLFNKCFEVEIINNDLFFDYKLRDGICKNKSATFLMKKIGVI